MHIQLMGWISFSRSSSIEYSNNRQGIVFEFDMSYDRGNLMGLFGCKIFSQLV